MPTNIAIIDRGSMNELFQSECKKQSCNVSEGGEAFAHHGEYMDRLQESLTGDPVAPIWDKEFCVNEQELRAGMERSKADLSDEEHTTQRGLPQRYAELEMRYTALEIRIADLENRVSDAIRNSMAAFHNLEEDIQRNQTDNKSYGDFTVEMTNDMYANENDPLRDLLEGV